MISVLISAIKIIVLLGFLIGIHEAGHFVVAKLCKVRVNEFAIGFGPTIWQKRGVETKYALRLIPLGGFVSMEGEEERSDAAGSFSNASIPKRIAIVAAGAIVNIIFAVILYFIIALSFLHNFSEAALSTGEFIGITFESLNMLFTGSIGVDQFMGPVGISQVIVQTSGFRDFLYMMALISMSLGVTNLIPFPPLDGGKVLFLVIEAIRRKPIKQETEVKIQLLGFAVLIALSLFIGYNDILRITS